MSSYRRFISYMYDSSQNSRKKNCGFLKIEIKQNLCQILFQLRGVPCQNKCNVYLCTRGKSPNYHFLQNIPIQKGTVNYKLLLPADHLTKDALPFSKCCGILCTDEEGNQCYTCWDTGGDLPLYQNALPPESPAVCEAEPETLTKSEPESRLKPEPGAESLTESEPEPESLAESEPEPESLAEPEPEPESLAESEPELSTERISEEVMEENQKIPAARSFPELWEHLQQEFPSLDPFEDHAIVETIKISPSDLGYLQSFNLDLGTNQFLLHGYKCYQHLLLGRLHEQMQYVLGIPGIYDPQEHFMAKTFGFPCFKPIRECRQKNGQYGYWLRCFRAN